MSEPMLEAEQAPPGRPEPVGEEEEVLAEWARLQGVVESLRALVGY